VTKIFQRPAKGILKLRLSYDYVIREQLRVCFLSGLNKTAIGPAAKGVWKMSSELMRQYKHHEK
jgi:hypothetical protein